MLATDFGYYFEEVGRGVNEGAQDPRAEHFSGADVEDAVVREVIQNSLDARRSGVRAVEIEFDLDQIPLDALPGIDGLRRAAANSLRAVGSETEGSKRIRAINERLAAPSISVLSISDYGTTGLEGAENDKEGGLSALTRSSGVSSSGGGRGGSFGIGAAVGVMASGIGTVGYLTRRAESSETIYASWAQLTGHVDDEGRPRRARGIFTRADVADELSYPRFGEEGFGPFEPRGELGTSVLIFDYLNADADRRLTAIRRAVVRNFLVAILEGDLVVSGRGVGGEWRLDQSTLDSVLQEDSELQEKIAPFRRAMELEPITRILPRIGEVELRIHELEPGPDGSLPRTLSTMLMRRPRMLIDIMKHRGLPKPYAAVFICRNDEGNELLRGLEGPSHDGWKSRGVRGDSALVDIVRSYIKEELRDALGFRASGSLDVANLAKMLPKLERQESVDGLFVDQGGDSQVTETWGTRPASVDQKGIEEPRGPKPLPVPPDGSRNGGEGRSETSPHRRADDRRAPSSSEPPERGGPEAGAPGGSDLVIRSFAGGGPGAVTLVVRNPAESSVYTELVLHWLDGNGLRSPLSITHARDADSGEPVSVSRCRGELTGIEVPGNSRRRFIVTSSEGSQIKLEVQQRGA